MRHLFSLAPAFTCSLLFGLASVLQPVTASAARTRITLSSEVEMPKPMPFRPMDERRFDFPKPEDEVVKFVWAEVKGAETYLFQIDDKDDFSPPLNRTHQRITGRPLTEAEVAGLAAGGYYWRVAAVDADGGLGPWSPVQRFSINAGAPPSSGGKGPKLEIESKIPIGARMLIRGMSSSEGRLEAYINGEYVEDVPVGLDGDFSVMLNASVSGENVIRLVAIDKRGRMTVREVTFDYHGN